MFGTNTVTGKSFFKNAPKDSLLVTSMFYTLQGEGPFSGQPAYFIRLSKCLFFCEFCDSFFDQGDYITYDEILTKAYDDIANFANFESAEIKRKVILVITGGEPLLQNNLSSFIQYAKYDFKKVQVETTGAVENNLPHDTYCVVSPKCTQDKEGNSIRFIKPRKNIMHRIDCFKFVLCHPSITKYKPYSEVPDWALDWAKSSYHLRKIYVSPMNIYLDVPLQSKIARLQNKELTMEERSTIDEKVSFWDEGILDREKNRLNHEYAAEYCMKTGCILSLQSHLYASLP